jgi:hypothetical protein
MEMAMPEDPGSLIERARRRIDQRAFECRGTPVPTCRDVIIFGSKTQDLPQ